MSVRTLWSCGVLVLGASLVVGAPARRAEGEAQAATPVDLSGRWRLNKELSDDEQAKEGKAVGAKAERETPAPGASGAPEGEEGGGRQGHAGGRSPGSGSVPSIDENDPRGAKRSAGAPDVMTVTQLESQIVVEEGPGQTRYLYPNGKTYRADEGATQVKTSWKDGKLVVEKKNVRGWRLVETWELLPNRARVVIQLHLEGGSRPKLSLRRVYDRDGARAPQ